MMDTMVIFHFYHMDRFLDDSFYFYRLDRPKILIDNFHGPHIWCVSA